MPNEFQAWKGQILGTKTNGEPKRIMVDNDGKVMVHDIIISGVSTSGSVSTLGDTTKNFLVDIFKDRIFKVTINEIDYYRKITGNTLNVLSFADIVTALSASCIYGDIAGGQITAVIDAKGTPGHDYTLVCTASLLDGATTTAELSGKVINVTLGTASDGVSASTTIGSGDNGVITVTVDTVGVAGDDYSIEAVQGEGASAELSASITDEKITVVLGTTAGVKASTTIGTGDNGVVTITADEVGVVGNDFSVEVVEGIGADVDLSAELADDKITVTLGTNAGTAASATINSSGNGVLTITADEVGTAGNEYSVEVVKIVEPNLDLSASLSTKKITITLATNGESQVDTAKTTTSMVATAVNNLEGVSATASGDSETYFTEAIAEVSFAGGLAPVLDDTKNTAALIATAVAAIDGVTATASGDGSTAFTEAIIETQLDNGAEPALDATKNTATLITAAITALAGVSASASGDGSTALNAVVAEKSFAGGSNPTVNATGTDVATAIDGLAGISCTMTGAGGIVAPTVNPATFSGGVNEIAVPIGANYEITNYA